VEVEENTADNNFSIALSLGIICHYLRDMVIVGKNKEDNKDHKGLRFVTSLLI